MHVLVLKAHGWESGGLVSNPGYTAFSAMGIPLVGTHERHGEDYFFSLQGGDVSHYTAQSCIANSHHIAKTCLICCPLSPQGLSFCFPLSGTRTSMASGAIRCSPKADERLSQVAVIE